MQHQVGIQVVDPKAELEEALTSLARRMAKRVEANGKPDAIDVEVVRHPALSSEATS